MSRVIESLEREQRRNVPAFQAGDRLRVHFQVIEGTRRRTQVFEGTVIKRQGSGTRETFTVRKQSFGVGVERTFPLHSPKIERIEVASRGDVRRAKLYYLRGRVGRRARVRERQYGRPEALALEPEGAADATGVQAEAPVLAGEEAGDASAESAAQEETREASAEPAQEETREAGEEGAGDGAADQQEAGAAEAEASSESSGSDDS